MRPMAYAKGRKADELLYFKIPTLEKWEVGMFKKVRYIAIKFKIPTSQLPMYMTAKNW